MGQRRSSPAGLGHRNDDTLYMTGPSGTPRLGTGERGPLGITPGAPMGFGPSLPPGPMGSLLGGLHHLSDAANLRAFAFRVLGSRSFGVGVIVGAAANPIRDIEGLFQLAKTFTLAEIHDQVGKGWWDLSRSPAQYGLYAGGRALLAVGALEMEQLRQAKDEQVAILTELGEMFLHPLEFLGKLGDAYQARWQQYQELKAKGDPESQFEAGKILGDLVMDIVLMVVDVADVAIKVAAKFPKLMRLAEALKLERGAGRAAGAGGGPTKPPVGAAPPAPPPSPRKPRAQARPPEEPAPPMDNVGEKGNVAPGAASPAKEVPEGRLRGEPVPLEGMRYQKLEYTKRSRAESDDLRGKFDNGVRKKFLQDMTNDPDKVAQLKQAGISDDGLAKMAKGKLPSKEWRVHHKVPLDDGGNNDFENLVLIKEDPYHVSLTVLQNKLTGSLAEGETAVLQWPTYDGIVYPPAP